MGVKEILGMLRMVLVIAKAITDKTPTKIDDQVVAVIDSILAALSANPAMFAPGGDLSKLLGLHKEK